MILILIGKTCAGKTTIRDLLKEKGFDEVVTYTTRPKREGEIDGKDYHFISDEEFINKIHSGFFAEYKTYNTVKGLWYYGTSRESLEKAEGDKVIILTPDGLSDLEGSISVPIFSVYIYANNRSIQTRLKDRGDNPLEIDRRIKTDNEDFLGAERKVNKIVYNNIGTKLDDIVDKILGFYNEWRDAIK